jgi:hypothetical protein
MLGSITDRARRTGLFNDGPSTGKIIYFISIAFDDRSELVFGGAAGKSVVGRHIQASELIKVA